MQAAPSSRYHKGNNKLVFLSNKSPLVELTKDDLELPLVTKEPSLWHYSVPKSMAHVATPGGSWTDAVTYCIGSSLSCILGMSKQRW